MKKAILTRALLTVSLGMFALAAACNTLEGAGKDIEAGGQAIQDAAD